MLDWLDKNSWTQKASARDEYGNNINLDNVDAESYDLYSALKISYIDDDSFWDAVDRLKTVYKMLFPEKWKKAVTFYESENKMMQEVHPLWRLNDELDSFADVRTLLIMVS